MFLRKLKVLVALVIIVALMLSGTVLAESETPPSPEEPAPSEAPEPAPSAPLVSHLSAPIETPSEEPVSVAAELAAGVAADGDPYWYVGSTLFASVFPSESCPTGTSELAGTCFKDADPVKRALQEINGGLLPTNRTLYVTGSASPYPAIDLNDTVYTLALQMKAFTGEDAGAGNPVVNGDIKLEDLLAGFSLTNFIVNGGVSIQESVGSVLIKDVKVSNHAGTGIGIDIGSFSQPHNGAVTIQNVWADGNSQLGAAITSVNGTLKISNSSFNFNDDGVPIPAPGGLSAYGGIFAGVNNGSILLEGVSASGNHGYGAQIFYFNKPLTVRDSLFNSNSYESGFSANGYNLAPTVMDTIMASHNNNYGLFIDTDGAVQLNKIETRQNASNSGVAIFNYYTPATVKVSNGLFANNGGGHGLEIISLGAVTLTSLQSFKNGGDGLYLDNCQKAGGTGPCQGSGNILLTSPAASGWAAANGFYSNGSHGVDILTKGAVTLTNLESEENAKDGIVIQSYLGTGTITINKNLPNWSNDISRNQNHGINIETMGSIILSDTSAEGNVADGLHMETAAIYPMNLTVTNGDFTGNGWYGINSPVYGNVTLTNVSASDNDWDWLDGTNYSGVYISNMGNVTIRTTSPALRSSFSNNSYDGLEIYSYGNVLISDADAFGNGYSGIEINNTTGPLPSIVKVTRSSADKNNYQGVSVITHGNVTLDTITSSGNVQFGAAIDACEDDLSGGCLNNASVTLRGPENVFDANGAYGLTVYAKGNISATNVAANDNGYAGVVLYNLYTGSASNVSLKSSGGFWNSITSNNHIGYDPAALIIRSYGTITLARVNASHNKYLGALLVNDSSSTPKSLTLADCHFDSNETGGLKAQISGPVIARGITANYNSTHVGSLDEGYGESVFEKLTADTNLDIWWVDVDPGASVQIDLSSLDFDSKLEVYDESGSLLYSDDDGGGSTNAQIIFTNGGTPLRIAIHATGKGDTGNYWLSVNDPSHNHSTSYSATGAELINNYQPNTPVLITSSTGIFPAFNQNNSDGLNVNTSGAATLSNLGASDNMWTGLAIQSIGNISITNSHPTDISFFNGNGSYGIEALSTGMITIRNRIMVISNGDDGILLNNLGASSPKTVTLANVYLANNADCGASILSGSQVSIANVISEYNLGDGLAIDNNYGAKLDVVVSGVNRFMDNFSTGLNIISGRNALVSGVTADRNTKMGIYISSIISQLRNITAQHNVEDGLFLYVSGNSLLDTVKAFDNGQGSDKDGLYVESSGFNVTVLRSAFIGNEGSGIEFIGSGGLLNLNTTFYYGNDTNLSGDLNIYDH